MEAIEFAGKCLVVMICWTIASTISGFVFAVFDVMKKDKAKRNQKQTVIINKQVNLTIDDPLSLKDGLEKMGFKFMCPKCDSDKLIMFGVEKISFECRDCGNIHKEGPLKVKHNQEDKNEN